MGRPKVGQTRFIVHESQVPEGYVPLTAVTRRDTQAEINFLRRACDAHNRGEIRAVKLVRSAGEVKTGRVWVHSGDFAAWSARQSKSERAAEAAPVAVAEPSTIGGDVLADVLREARSLRETNAALVSQIDRLLDAFSGLQAAIELQAEAANASK